MMEEGRLNITISGGTLSGKSTMLLHLKEILEKEGFDVGMYSDQQEQMKIRNNEEQRVGMKKIKDVSITLVEVNPKKKKRISKGHKKHLRERKESLLTMGDEFRQKKRYSIEDVLKHVIYEPKRSSGHKLGKHQRIDFDGDLINMASQRYQTFDTHGTTCVKCGMEGQFFLKERSCPEEGHPWHFNLYGIDENGKLRLITKDHVIPIKHGGSSAVSNYQTMCTKCNREKGHKLEKN